MNKSSSFEDLIVWQKAHQFVMQVYASTKEFPKEELFGLTSQYRRAAVSIAANIAEGYGKKGDKDKLRFYNIAEGSINECKYYIILSKDLGYITKPNFDMMYSLLSEVQRLLNTYTHVILKKTT